MQRIKRTIMVALAIPVLYAGSCFPFSDTFFRSVRDAAIDGTSDFVQDATYNVLDNNIDVGGTGG